MEWSQFPQWFVAAILGAGIIKVFDQVFYRARQQQERKEDLVKELEGLLDEFARLEAFYRFFARRKASIARDSGGELLRDDAGKFVIEEQIFEPEARFEPAFKELYGSANLNTLIAQKVIEIRIMLEQKRRIADTLDPSGELMKALISLLYETDHLVRFWIDKSDFELMVQRLNEAHISRKKIQTLLQEYRTHGARPSLGRLRRFLLWR